MEFEDTVCYKYVRLSTNEFRFVAMSIYGLKHKDLVKEGEKAISAGIIGIYPNKFTFIDKGSLSLNLYSCCNDDTKLLEEITKRKGENHESLS
jgi:hypothetical protein